MDGWRQAARAERQAGDLETRAEWAAAQRGPPREAEREEERASRKVRTLERLKAKREDRTERPIRYQDVVEIPAGEGNRREAPASKRTLGGDEEAKAGPLDPVAQR